MDQLDPSLIFLSNWIRK